MFNNVVQQFALKQAEMFAVETSLNNGGSWTFMLKTVFITAESWSFRIRIVQTTNKLHV